VKEVILLKSSRGEIIICDILDMAGLEYVEEYSYPDLISSTGRPLRFDFAVLDDNGEVDFLIEFQGIQHYEPKSKFGGISGLRKQQFNDARKRAYCKEHGIKLIAIPYWDMDAMDYDYIMRAAGY
jgi:hypothetical protein